MRAPASAKALAAAAVAAWIAGVGVKMPLSACQPTRNPLIATADESRRGMGATNGSRPSGPAITRRISSRSATDRAIGPSWVSGSWMPPNETACPVRGTRPWVGFSPAVPQQWDGTRMLPPVSLPTSKAHSALATAAAAPPLLPPGLRSGSNGLRVRPNTRLSVSKDRVNSGVLVLPSSTAPAALRRAATVASA